MRGRKEGGKKMGESERSRGKRRERGSSCYCNINLVTHTASYLHLLCSQDSLVHVCGHQWSQRE